MKFYLPQTVSKNTVLGYTNQNRVDLSEKRVMNRVEGPVAGNCISRIWRELRRPPLFSDKPRSQQKPLSSIRFSAHFNYTLYQHFESFFRITDRLETRQFRPSTKGNRSSSPHDGSHQNPELNKIIYKSPLITHDFNPINNNDNHV